ncbi:isochorismatase family protein [Desulfotignum phosphitoxidans]|uniref:Putative YcaC-like amidohydrolase n=1 Tax=Desulfotignum phosphitoxidans DSM 13687 TaxID=1286635 RepID=S0G1B9_9BACT|nr:isochorismatase family protein [Desulfotignum phosphitoxidans]EMS79244.1 putative YcaC-like amidohydrolase [Desulfotignum phosphitoxidans DSM 13687]
MKKSCDMFSIDKTVALLVDVQGKLARMMCDKETLFDSLEIFIKGMKILGVPILWMEQIPSKLGPTVDEIQQLMAEETPIAKDSFSCCNEPGFMEKFEALSRSQVLVTGIETHICVFQTARDLVVKGCDVQVVSDCVSSRTQENKAVGLQRIVQAGAQITSVEMIFFELLQRAKGDHFRQIISLIK